VKKQLVLAVGNRMMGDDAAGPMLAERMRHEPVPGWEVIDGGSAPENILYSVRELEPERVLVVDAADMDLEPGEVRFINASKLEDPFMMTTHTLPLSYLIESLQEFVPQVDLLGIQPDIVSFGFPVSPGIREAVDRVYESLKLGLPAWELLQPASENQDGKGL
jgi:hydrogenase 3 maturation protease